MGWTAPDQMGHENQVGQVSKKGEEESRDGVEGESLGE